MEDIITTTHYYLKFKPKTEEELDIIKNDTLLYWFNYPLDYELSEGGSSYHDPEVLEDQPTYQYTYAEVKHKLPEGVEYEILEHLFIPEEEEGSHLYPVDNVSGFTIKQVENSLKGTTSWSEWEKNVKKLNEDEDEKESDDEEDEEIKSKSTDAQIKELFDNW